MVADEYVKKLDELNKLRDCGVINEKEYDKQVNLLEKKYSKIRSNYQGNSTNRSSNILGFLISFICIICAIGFFQKFFYNGINTDTFKYDISSIDNYDTFENNYNNIILGTDYNYDTSENNYNDITLGTDYNYDTFEKNSDYNIFETDTSVNNNTNIDDSNSQVQSENKQTYNINIRKEERLFSKGNIVLTVLNYQTETNNSEVGPAAQGQEWVIVNMKFENMSNSTVIINKNDFKLVDGAGRYGYRPWYEHLDSELDIIEIRSGQAASFSVRFVYYQNNEMFLRYYNPDLETHSYDEYIDLKLR